MPAVAHLYAHNGPPSATGDNPPAASTSAAVGGGGVESAQPSSIARITEGEESQDGDDSVGEGKAAALEVAAPTEDIGVCLCWRWCCSWGRLLGRGGGGGGSGREGEDVAHWET